MRSLLVVIAVACSLPACGKQSANEPAAAEAASDSEGEQKAKEAAPLDESRRPDSAEAPAAPGAAPAPAQERDVLSERGRDAPANLDEAMALLESTLSDLNRALTLSAPDCVMGARLRDRVCDLAEHICRLTDESAEPSAQELCGDGRARCADARKRYAESCPTP